MTSEETWKTVTTHKSPSPATRKIIEQFPRGKNILDFGSGRGRNTLFLHENKFDVFPYEPHYDKIKNHMVEHDHTDYEYFTYGAFDIVLCSYILNILPIKERTVVLKQLSNLTWKYLIIEVRSKGHIDDLAEASNWTRFEDGYITSRKTFQKGFNHNGLMHEINANIKDIIGCNVWCRKSGNLSVILERRIDLNEE